MNCKEFQEWLPDHLAHTLTETKSVALEAHLSECAECRGEVEIWQKLSLIPMERPSQRLRANFNIMLEQYQQEQRAKNPAAQEHHGYWAPWMGGLNFRPSFAHGMLALIMLVSGFQLGRSFVPTNNTNNSEISALRTELAQKEQQVALSMMQQDSASSRIEGVNYSVKVERAEPVVLTALLHTLNYDNSVDVRLAAVEALRKYHDQPEVRIGVVGSLDKQKSPLVQIALIDLLVDMKEKSALEPLEKLQQTPSLNPIVKQHLEWGIRQLQQGH